MALALDAAWAPRGGACGSAEEAVVAFRLELAHSPPRIGVRHEIQLRCQGIGDVAVRPDRRLLATAGWDGRVRVYTYRSGRTLAVIKVRGGGGGGVVVAALPASSQMPSNATLPSFPLPPISATAQLSLACALRRAA